MGCYKYWGVSLNDMLEWSTNKEVVYRKSLSRLDFLMGPRSLLQSSPDSLVETSKSLVALGRNDLLSRSLEQWGQSSLSVLWRRWDALSMTACSFVSILCSSTSSRETY